MYRRSKYNNKKTIINGIKFDSKKEANYYLKLKQLEERGLITDLKLQVKFPLVINDKPVKIRSKGYPNGRKTSYIADFSYFDCSTGEFVIVDVKGFDTAISRLKRAIVETIYDIEITIV